MPASIWVGRERESLHSGDDRAQNIVVLVAANLRVMIASGLGCNFWLFGFEC
jgi:hypothetical protein